MQVSAFLATSLDGFIARPNGDLDWLERANGLLPEGEDCGYARFFASVDCLVMGRKTFEKVLSFPQWPYAQKPVVVLSRSGIEIPQHLRDTVSCSSESPKQLCAGMAAAGLKRIYLDGGQIIRTFLAAGLLNDLTITRIPVLIHRGIPLFDNTFESSGNSDSDVWFEMVESRFWPFGFTQEVWKTKLR
jgi:dihydrofolate reductase